MVFKSPYKSVDIPPLDIPTFIFSHAISNTEYGKNPSLTVMADGSSGESLSFEQLRNLSDAFASGLVNNLKMSKGDVLALFTPNSIEYPGIAFGTLSMGGILTPANPAYNPNELAHQLGDSRAKAIVTTVALLPVVKQAMGILKKDKSEFAIVVTDKCQEPPTNFEGYKVLYFDDLLSTKPFTRLRIDQEEVAKNTTAYICYSSGTTGLAKGVMLTHRNIVANVVQNISFEETDEYISRVKAELPRQTFLGVLPFFHIFGLTVTLHLAFAKGHSVVVIPKFDFELLLRVVQEYKVNVAHLVPPIFLAIANSPLARKYDLSSLRYMISGAAPLGKGLQKKVSGMLGIPVGQGYGLTETSPVVHRMTLYNVVPGSIGVLSANVEAKIVDVDTGKELGVNQEGEIWCRGPNIMKGYLNNRKATEESIDKDGFFHTGDIGYVDDKGYWYITDRLKELIKFKGFQVAPAELEGILLTHPEVLDCAVIGVYDDTRHSEVPKAFVVRARAASGDTKKKEQELATWLNNKVAKHKWLRGGIEFVDEIPKSTSGKILRRILREKEKTKRDLKSRQPKL
ncbi:hypothetical protein H4219_004378 [Mycoemilia scoparia]|uniref:Uncharacterized protein n=1 Tax=Mycoemilia scoparia TaxID=417184 RepID=A0A9W8DLK1_9FUNG|nr:hypothetical protein H4219_004378 [Mycoemilia scoparia]